MQKSKPVPRAAFFDDKLADIHSVRAARAGPWSRTSTPRGVLGDYLTGKE